MTIDKGMKMAERRLAYWNDKSAEAQLRGNRSGGREPLGKTRNGVNQNGDVYLQR